jgi:hypothetical protein
VKLSEEKLLAFPQLKAFSWSTDFEYPELKSSLIVISKGFSTNSNGTRGLERQ